MFLWASREGTVFDEALGAPCPVETIVNATLNKFDNRPAASDPLQAPSRIDHHSSNTYAEGQEILRRTSHSLWNRQ